MFGNEKMKYTRPSLDKLVNFIDENGSSVSDIKQHFSMTDFSVRNMFKEYDLKIDNRQLSNSKRKIPVPSRSELEFLYTEKNLTLLDISKIYNTSNVTVRKWFQELGIELLPHSQTISKKVVPKIVEYNRNNFGYDHFFGTGEGKEKVKRTFIKNYGVPYHPIGNTSLSEIEVLDYMNSLIPGFEKTFIGGKEIDVCNKELGIGIEYCGLEWHREGRKGKMTHYQKYDVCRDNNIRLFTIFEDEWILRKDQIKGFLKSTLKKNENKLNARNLKVLKKEYNNIGVLQFIEKYHIQGNTVLSKSNEHYCLYDGNDLISVMTVGKHHRNNKDIIINRYCVKSDHFVIGGAKRLFNHILKDNKNCVIKTWSDNRYSEGELYKTLGFRMFKELPKDYSYVKNGKRKSKQSMKKSLIGAESNQTEYQRVLELGWDRIWDCGKKTWLYDNRIK